MSENKQQLSALEKIDEILLRCDELQREYGLEIKFTLFDPTIIKEPETNPTFQNAFPSNKLIKDSEVFHLHQLMEEMNFISNRSGRNTTNIGKDFNGSMNNRNFFSLLSDGYKRISELRKSIDSQQAFIAMWFAPSMNEAFRAIKEACEEAKEKTPFTAYRVDKDEHNDNITMKIIGEIKRSSFLIADFTGNRGGVYWEAGFPKGLGREVIHCMREKEFNKEKPHFDVQQINFIVWQNEQDLKDKLIDRIRASVD